MLFVSVKNQDRVFSGISADSSDNSGLASNKKTVEASNVNYPMSYLKDLGKLIIEILSGISLLEHDLLAAFSTEFQENCLGMLQQTDNLERATESVERIIHFILLLEQHGIHRGENWPLVDIVGPMLAKSFPLIRSQVSYYCANSLDGVRFYILFFFFSIIYLFIFICRISHFCTLLTLMNLKMYIHWLACFYAMCHCAK